MPTTLPTRKVVKREPHEIKFGAVPTAPFVPSVVGPDVIIIDPDPWAPAPTMVDWIGANVSWGMMSNDVIQDCVEACMGHLIEAWTGIASKKITLPDSAIEQAYSDITGYNPRVPGSDNGTAAPAALVYWRSHGLSGHYIDAWQRSNAVKFPALMTESIKYGVNYFGGVILILALPVSASTYFHHNLPWDGDMGPAQDFHCVPVLAYDGEWLDVITWGGVQRASWRWLFRYLLEAYCVSSSDWITASGSAPSGKTLAQLDAKLKGWGTVIQR